uniref:SHSP domain-containing protein n=1 Tax=Tetraselmis chuii TaxID=63592 RepID=A0A7S1SY59_9CHLO|mmetsp:Transcript_35572/g.63492  ORF Transcript_35572/g.63492 Transcript_35572/m.63492 type:complete len:128 (+) Transcript_35572:281-664(+)|eukprot:CAMPEP_0177772684 /NCGR_PEP_ID=MMETSP0491_2-20121128/12403_1 /TAXON_ID=63592 /ORGANISM="Tetraselmis chuii, Strain PLY429" /LENGTH=127 /DNA_ID=CAMNT_0019290609 /DNA_START=229 /DNA_END=612 /DNA_ORIENTATION=-
MAANTSTPAVFNVDVSPPAAAPEFNVQESKGSFDITGDMKNKENIKLGLTQDRILTIVGEESKSYQKDEDGESKTVTEKAQYQRAVPLPVSVDESAISAKMTNEGQLHLCMPKRDVETAPNTGVGVH